MNEDKIAAELAQRTIEPTPVEVPVTAAPEAPQNFIDKLLPEELLTRSQLLDYFQVSVTDRHDPRIDDYINTVYEWARTQAGEGGLDQLLRVIMAQEQNMGATLKPDRLRRMGEYVKIAKIRQNLAMRERNLYG